MTDLTFTYEELEKLMRLHKEFDNYLDMLIRIKSARLYYQSADPAPTPPAGQSPDRNCLDQGEHQLPKPEPPFDHETDDYEDPTTYCDCGNQMDPEEKRLFGVCKDCR